MKTARWLICLLAVAAVAEVHAQPQVRMEISPELRALLAKVPPDGVFPATVAKRELNQRVWERIRVETNSLGEVLFYTNVVVELGSGLHYEQDGDWLESKEDIEIVKDGAVARQGPHKASFAVNANSAWTVSLLTPDSKLLKSKVLGLALYDYKSGKNVMIAALKDSDGLLVGNNQIIYTNAFDGLQADLRYTYTTAGLEQDVILRERPPLPEEFDFEPHSTRLQVWTEFFDTPQPVRYQRTKKRWLQATEDQLLDFGAMKIGYGAVFGTDTEEGKRRGMTTEKEWVQIEGRTFLIEDVSYRWITPHLRKLRVKGQAGISKPGSNDRLYAVSTERLIPEPRPRGVASTNQIQLASVSLEEPGLVLDYSLVNTTNNYTFRADTTYYVSGQAYLSGTTIIEGGTVIKFNNDAELNILGTVDCRTEAYRPATLTAKTDNTVGESVTNGSPTGVYAGVALSLDNGGELKYLRVLYAKEGIYSPQNYTIKHSQFVHCGWGLITENATFSAQNILMYDVGTNFFGRFYHGTAEHLTSHQTASLTDDWEFQYYTQGCEGGPPSSAVTLVNSLLVGVTNSGVVPVSWDHVETAPTASGVLQTVGAGSHYLANPSHRNAGTLGLTSSLLAELKSKTTYPPIVLTNNFTANTNLLPQASRDTDVPDLGFHYDPLDYVVNGRTVSAVLTLTNGVALGTYGASSSYGLGLNSGNLVSEGTPTRLNWIVRYNTVQEQSTTNWSASTVGPSVKKNSSAANVIAKFTGWSLLAGIGDHFNDLNGSTNPGRFSHSQFGGGKFTCDGGSSAVTNCLWQRVYVTLKNDEDGAQFYLFNNLLYGGTLYYRARGYDPILLAYDNLFDQTTITKGSGSEYFVHDYNGYVTNKNRLYSNGPHDVILTNNPVYQTSYLGSYYYATNDGKLSRLINVGSRTADLATLYHFTTTTNQVKETNSTVDIGFHYVAVDGNGNPIDTNGDGIPDYLEDANGNGQNDPGETPWHLVISSQPTGATITYGDSVSFSVQATGALYPVSYQWRRGGVNIAGATSSLYSIARPVVADSGFTYDVIVSAGIEQVTSSPAVLTVNPRQLTITADNKVKALTAPVPEFTSTILGLQVGDSDITNTYSTLPPANQGSGAGSYAIVPALHDPNGKAVNYAGTLVNGVLTVDPDMPIANDGDYTTTKNTSVSITLSGQDPGIPPDPLTGYNAPSSTTRGGTLTGPAPYLTYTPPQDFEGDDSFTFTVSIGVKESAPATVTIHVGAPCYTKIFTSDADFDLGILENLNHNAPNQNQLQLDEPGEMQPYLNVACSGRGTMIRVDVNEEDTTKAIVGQYLTSPEGMGRDPSRTTVDRLGNVWVANRGEYSEVDGTPMGSVTKIGWIRGGERGIKDPPDVQSGYTFTPDPDGEWIRDTVANPITGNFDDRDGDGLIHTSRGWGNILPWDNVNGVDSEGGVQTAEDELILAYVRVLGTGTRTVAVARNNDVWVGGSRSPQWHQKVLANGTPVEGTEFSLGAGGYGGLIDANGVLWSARSGQGLLRYDTANKQGLVIGNAHGDYGLGIDPQMGEIWHSSVEGGGISKYSPDGQLLGDYYHSQTAERAQGVVVDALGNVWVAHALDTGSTVGHLRTDGTFIGNVSLDVDPNWAGKIVGPTGVAVDTNGMIWVANYNHCSVMRINPSLGSLGPGGVPVGQVDRVVQLGRKNGAGVGCTTDAILSLPGKPYNYSDMTGFLTTTATRSGTWTVIQDGGSAAAEWKTLSWGGPTPPAGTQLSVQVRVAEAEEDLDGQAYQTVSNPQTLTGIIGRYLQIRVMLSREYGVTDTPVLQSLTVSWCDAPQYAPTIVSQPQDLNACPDGVASFNVVANGQYLSYQWRFNGDAIAGATDPTYVINSLTPAHLGNYSVEVSNPFGSIVSRNATLSFLQAPLVVVGKIADAKQPATKGSFAIIRSCTTGSLTVNYSAAGTATPGPATDADYISLPGSVLIPDGESAAIVEVVPIPRSTTQDKTVVLTVSRNSAYVLGSSPTATVTIHANQPPSLDSIDELKLPANHGTYTISLNTLIQNAHPVPFDPEDHPDHPDPLDPDNDQLSFVVDEVVSGLLLINGTPRSANNCMITNNTSAVWIAPTTVEELTKAAFRVRVFDGLAYGPASAANAVPVHIAHKARTYLYAWGNNWSGQLGNGLVNNPARDPERHDHLNWQAQNNLIPRDSRWKYYDYSKGGRGFEVTPQRVLDVGDMVSLYSDVSMTSAVGTDGHLYQWGMDYGYFMFGIPKARAVLDVSDPPSSTWGFWTWGSELPDVEGGAWTVWNPLYLLSPTAREYRRPKKIDSNGVSDEPFGDLVSVSGDYYGRRLVLKSDGTLWSWGFNGFEGVLAWTGYESTGLLGRELDSSAPQSDVFPPADVTPGGGEYWKSGMSPRQIRIDGNGLGNLNPDRKFVEIHSGPTAAIARCKDGSVWFWGNLYGGHYACCDGGIPSLPYTRGWKFRLAGTENDPVWEPHQVTGLGTDIIQMSMRQNHIVLLREDGSVSELGYVPSLDPDAEPGTGEGYRYDPIDLPSCYKATPQAVSLPGNPVVTQVSAGNSFGVAVTSEGVLWVWGNLKDSEAVAPRTIDFPDGIQIVKATAGDQFIMAVDHRGRLWGWGMNWYGVLGRVESEQWWDWKFYDEPVQIDGLENVVDVFCGEGYGVFAIASPEQSKPTGLVATPKHQKVELKWNAYPSASFYRVYRSTARFNGYAEIGTPSGNAYTDESPPLNNGTIYYYKVAAVVNGIDTDKSWEVAAKPLAPPDGVTSPNAQGQCRAVNISWTAPAGLVQEYAIRRAVAADPNNPTLPPDGNFFLRETLEGNAESYTDDAVVQGAVYYYKVVAVNSAGSSPATTFGPVGIVTANCVPKPHIANAWAPDPQWSGDKWFEVKEVQTGDTLAGNYDQATLCWTAPEQGSWVFLPNDLVRSNWEMLIETLRGNLHNGDAVAAFLWGQFSSQQQSDLVGQSLTYDQKVSLLIAKLNDLVDNGCFFEDHSTEFSQVTPSPKTTALHGAYHTTPTVPVLIELNRRLLMDWCASIDLPVFISGTKDEWDPGLTKFRIRYRYTYQGRPFGGENWQDVSASQVATGAWLKDDDDSVLFGYRFSWSIPLGVKVYASVAAIVTGQNGIDQEGESSIEVGPLATVPSSFAWDGALRAVPGFQQVYLDWPDNENLCEYSAMVTTVRPGPTPQVNNYLDSQDVCVELASGLTDARYWDAGPLGVGLKPTAFTPVDIRSVWQLQSKLIAVADPVSVAVWDLLTTTERNDLSSFSTVSEGRQLFADAFTRIVNISGNQIFIPSAVGLTDEDLSDETERLNALASKTADELATLNRLLLEDAYRTELARFREATPAEFVSGDIKDAGSLASDLSTEVNAVAVALWSRWTSIEQTEIASQPTSRLLATKLTGAIRKEDAQSAPEVLLTVQGFPTVQDLEDAFPQQFTPRTKELFRRRGSLSSDEIVLLNRLLIEETWPSYIESQGAFKYYFVKASVCGNPNAEAHSYWVAAQPDVDEFKKRDPDLVLSAIASPYNGMVNVEWNFSRQFDDVGINDELHLKCPSAIVGSVKRYNAAGSVLATGVLNDDYSVGEDADPELGTTVTILSGSNLECTQAGEYVSVVFAPGLSDANWQFCLERKTGPNGDYVRITETGFGLAFLDEDVVNGQSYYYRVRAYDKNYNLYEAETDGAVVPGGSQDLLLAATPGNSFVDLEWTAFRAASFEVKHALAEDGPWETVAVLNNGNALSSPPHTYRHLNARNGVGHYYYVTATTPTGFKVDSDPPVGPVIPLATLTPLPPDGFRGELISGGSTGAGRIYLTWRPRAGVARYQVFLRDQTRLIPLYDLAADGIVGTSCTYDVPANTADSTAFAFAIRSVSTPDANTILTSSLLDTTVTYYGPGETDNLALRLKVAGIVVDQTTALELTGPTNLTLAVDASLPNMNKVTFYADDNVLAVVTAEPYQTTWSHVPGGQHELRATVETLEGARGLNAIVATYETAPIANINVTVKPDLAAYRTSVTDLQLPAPGLPIALSRAYESRDTASESSVWALGWKANWQVASLTISSDLGEAWKGVYGEMLGYIPRYYIGESETHQVTVTLPDGQTLQFAPHLDYFPETRPDEYDLGATVSMGFKGFFLDQGELTCGDAGTGVEVECSGDPNVWDGDPITLGGGQGIVPTSFTYTSPDGTKYLFVPSGTLTYRLITITDRNDNSLTYTYGSGNGPENGKVTEIRHSCGRTISFAYEYKSQSGTTEISVRDSVAKYTVGGRPVLVYVIHDSTRELRTVKRRLDRNEATDSLAYETTTYQYGNTDAGPNYAARAAANAGRLTDIFDARNVRILHNQYRPDDAVNGYVSNGDLLNQVNADARGITEYVLGLDANGKFNGEITVTRTVGSETRTMQVIHDASGAISGVTEPAEGTTPGDVATQTTYNELGQLVSKANADGKIKSYEYDEKGRLVSVTDENGNKTSVKMDDNGLPLEITNPAGNTSRNTFDTDGNPLTANDLAQTEIEYKYYEAQNDGPNAMLFKMLKSERRSADRVPYTVVTKYTYKAIKDFPVWGDVEMVTQQWEDTPDHAVGNPITVTYETDHNGNRLAEIKQRTKTGGIAEFIRTEYTYDAIGRVTDTEVKTASALAGPWSIVPATHTHTEYNALGKQRKTTDGYGRQTQFVYDISGNLIETIYPDGTVTRTTYDDDGRPEYVQDRAKPNGDVTTAPATKTEYDASGRATNVLRYGNVTLTKSPADAGDFVALGTVDNEYKNKMVATAPADPALTTSRNYYDNAGRVKYSVEVRNPIGNSVVTRYRYDDGGRRTNMMVYRTCSQFNAQTGEPEPQSGDLPDETTYGYDFNGNQVWVRDALQRQTDYEYDDANRQVRVTFPPAADGTRSSRSTVYDGLGQRIQETDEAGVNTTYTYDFRGLVTSVTLAAGTSQQSTTIYEYDELGNPVSQQDAEGRVTTFGYDALGRRTTRLLPGATSAAEFVPGGSPNPNIETVIYHYMDHGANPDTRLEFRRDFKGQMLVSEFDISDRLIRKTPALLLAGGVSGVAAMSSLNPDGPNNALTFTATTTGSAGNGMTILFTDQGGLAAGNNAAATYDAANRILTIAINPGATTAAKVVEVAAGAAVNVALDTSVEPANNGSGTITLAGQVSYTYTTLGQRSEVVQNASATSGGDRTAKYAYDNQGRLRVKNSPEGTLSYTYDNRGLITKISAKTDYTWPAPQQDGNARNYVWDDNSPWSVAATRADSAEWNYSYDNLSRIEKVNPDALPGTSADVAYTYSAVGALETSSYRNGLVTTYTYSDRNWLRRLRTTTLGGSLVANFDYDEAGEAGSPTTPSSWGNRLLSPTGQRRRVAETYGSVSRAVDYDYDLLRRLADEILKPSVGGNPTATVSYDGTGGGVGYDRVGNRQSRQVTGSLPGVATYTGHAFNERDLLNSGNGFTYDANGNTSAEAGGATYTYDVENRMVKRSGGGLDTIELAYDEDGNRVKKTVSPAGGGAGAVTKYLVENLNPTGFAQVMEERNGSDVTSTTYVYGLDLVSQKHGSIVRYYGYDGLGSVRYLTDGTSGLVTDTYTYDAFGILIGQTPSSGQSVNNYRYTGEQWDPDLAMYYLRARYYEPEVGRFWTMDSFEGNQADPLSLHKYLYANANPVNVVDPSGHEGNYISLTATMSLMYTLITFELRGANAALKGARALFGADQNVNDLIHGMDIINIVDEKVGQVMLVGGAMAGGFKVLSMLKNFLTGSTAKRLAEKALLVLQKLAPRAPSACFIAGTLVATEIGQIPIENIKPGDQVWSWNEASGNFGLQTVTETTRRLTETITEIHLSNDSIISTTPEHPFWVETKGWVQAGALKPGDLLLTDGSEAPAVVAIATRKDSVYVFNFEVEVTHTYLVGEIPVVVHNNNLCFWGQRSASLKTKQGVSGIYIIRSRQPGIAEVPDVYVGEAKDLYKRLVKDSNINNPEHAHRYKDLIKDPNYDVITIEPNLGNWQGPPGKALRMLEEFFIRLTGANGNAGSKHGWNDRFEMDEKEFADLVNRFGLPDFKPPQSH